MIITGIVAYHLKATLEQVGLTSHQQVSSHRRYPYGIKLG
jgi:hypothetical protein